mmetsp:Transcript_133849/g.299189  ORF Transcript_133849/g.299189 Transcript_133849/m.299189 type:complete len:219 (-) Transcript_133849:44-700(-)
MIPRIGELRGCGVRLRCFAFAVAVLALAGTGRAEEQQEQQEHPEQPEQPPEKITRGMVAKRLGGRSLACHACKMAMDRFRYQVARRIASKMSPEKKKQVFWSRLKNACDSKNFAQLYAIAGPTGEQRYEDVHAAATDKKKIDIGHLGPEVKQELLEACKYFVDGHQDELLKAVLKSKAGRAGAENFHRLICKKPAFCTEAEIPKAESDEDAEEEDSEL